MEKKLGVFLLLAALAGLVWLNRSNVVKKMENTKLGENFTLDEFVKTATGFENIPDANAVANLRELVSKILQPLRTALAKPVVITSGYRSAPVNLAVGGSSTSQHLTGQAADFYVSGMTNAEIISSIRNLNLPYDQLIDEQLNGKKWIHVSYKPFGRKQWMTARTDPATGGTIYKTISYS